MTTVDHELDDLKREFLTEAEEKVMEMHGVVEAHRTSANLDRLAYLAHQLKGSGGSYGYQDISAEAAEIEKAVERIAGGKADGMEAKIEQHVARLRAEIARCSEELSAQ